MICTRSLLKTRSRQTRFPKGDIYGSQLFVVTRTAHLDRYELLMGRQPFLSAIATS